MWPFLPQNLETACHSIVTKPKPKVEPPKDDKKEAEGEEAKKEGEEKGKEEAGETPAATAGEGVVGEKMEEDAQPAPEGETVSNKDEDMDLDWWTHEWMLDSFCWLCCYLIE